VRDSNLPIAGEALENTASAQRPQAGFHCVSLHSGDSCYHIWYCPRAECRDLRYLQLQLG